MTRASNKLPQMQAPTLRSNKDDWHQGYGLRGTTAIVTLPGEVPHPVVLSRLGLTQMVLSSRVFERTKPDTSIHVRLGELGSLAGVHGTVLQVVENADGMHAHVRLQDVGPALRAALSNFLYKRARPEQIVLDPPSDSHVEIIDQPERIDEIWAALRNTEAWGFFDTADGRGYGRIQPDGSLLLGARTMLPSSQTFPFVVQGSYSRLEFVAELHENKLVTPDTIRRVRQRLDRRLPAPPRLMVSYRVPLWPNDTSSRRVLDLSHRGLSFEVDPLGQDTLCPGLALELELVWKCSAPLRLSAIVRHVSLSRGSDGFRCGVQIVPANSPDLQRWDDELDLLLHPNTHLMGPLCGGLWELFEKSGYLELSGKTPQDFKYLHDAFIVTHERLSTVPEVGFPVLWSTQRRVEAAVSQLQVWPGTWLGYHMARRRDHRPLALAGDHVLRDIHVHSFEHLSRMPHVVWSIVYLQRNAGFGRLLLEKHAASQPFRALEATCGEARGDSDVRVRIATQHDLEWLHDRVATTVQPSYAAATGLTLTTFDIASIRETWQQATLTRERVILVAEHGGTSAAAVADLGADGLHLYGLLDIVRMFPLGSGGERLFPTLIQAVGTWYREHGKRTFVYFHHCEADEVVPEWLECRDLGHADAMMMPASSIPEYIEHVYEITAPREG